MRTVAPYMRRIVGWLLVLSGVLLVIAEVVGFVDTYVLHVVIVWLGFLPELAFALALIFIIAWFADGALARIAFAAIAVDLVMHAIVGLFIHDAATADVLIVMYICLSIAGCLLSAALVLTRQIFSTAANVLLAIQLILLACVGLTTIGGIVYSTINGFPFGALGEPGDFSQLLPEFLRDVLLIVVEIVVGLLQAVTGFVVLRKKAPAASN